MTPAGRSQVKCLVGCVLVMGVARVEAQAAPRLRERVLATLPSGDGAWSPYARRVTFSPDGRHHGYIAQRDDRWAAVIDGVVGPEGDDVRDLQLAGGTAVYRIQRDRAWHVVRDGVASDPYREVTELRLTDDGAHVTYAARGRSGWSVVRDGVAGEVFDRIEQLVTAGARWAYVGVRGHEQYAVVDGVVGAPAAHVADLAFSADGTRCAYLVTLPGGEEAVVSDARRWPIASGAASGGLTWTGDGNLLAWWERRGETRVVVVEGEPITVPDRRIEQLAVSARKGGGPRKVAVVTVNGARGEQVITLQGDDVRVGSYFFEIDMLTLDRDGARLAYRGWDGDGAHWIVDGVIGPAHDDVLAAGFSPDGAHVAYHAQARDRSWRMIVDGVPGFRTDMDDGGLGPPVWSPDGRHLAYFVLDGDASVILDGRRASSISDAVELRWLAYDRRRTGKRGSARLAFGTVDRAGRVVWRELTP